MTKLLPFFQKKKKKKKKKKKEANETRTNNPDIMEIRHNLASKLLRSANESIEHSGVSFKRIF
jgi:hypothetical protein